MSWWAITGLISSSLATLATGHVMRQLFTRSEGFDEVRLMDVKLVRGDMINYTLPFLIELLDSIIKVGSQFFH